jgi:hypothetical protein
MTTSMNFTPPNKSSFRLSSSRLLATGLVLLAAAGCNPTYRTHGTTNIVGRYTGVELMADLPGTISVSAALAAAEEQFRDQGYSILRSSATDQSGEVVALPPRTNDFPRATVKITAGDGVTKVSIWKSPINEEALCRGILTRICRKLGL